MKDDGRKLAAVSTEKKDAEDAAFRPMEVLRPRAQVEKQIRSAILSGELSGGQRLQGETELARQFGVSRNTVREALRSLETQGLIRKTPGAGGGSFVQSIDHSSLRTVLEESMRHLVQLGSVPFEELSALRQFLEVPAVRLAAVNRSDAQLKALRDNVEDQRRLELHDPKVPDLDKEFHSKIAEASGNRTLMTFVQALHQQTEPVSYLDLKPEVGKTAWRQHKEIVEAIEAQDPDRAQKAIVTHLEYLREHIAISLAAAI